MPFLPGRPVPFARTRGRGAHRYTPERYRLWKQAVGWHLLRAKVKPIEGPVAVSMIVTPDGVDVDFRPVATTRPKGIRGDLDNYAKAVLDAAQGIAYHDDRQVTAVSVAFADEPTPAGPMIDGRIRPGGDASRFEGRTG